jgi:hypothetical protein
MSALEPFLANQLETLNTALMQGDGDTLSLSKTLMSIIDGLKRSYEERAHHPSSYTDPLSKDLIERRNRTNSRAALQTMDRVPSFRRTPHTPRRLLTHRFFLSNPTMGHSLHLLLLHTIQTLRLL